MLCLILKPGIPTLLHNLHLNMQYIDCPSLFFLAIQMFMNLIPLSFRSLDYFLIYNLEAVLNLTLTETLGGARENYPVPSQSQCCKLRYGPSYQNL